MYERGLSNWKTFSIFGKKNKYIIDIYITV